MLKKVWSSIIFLILIFRLENFAQVRYSTDGQIEDTEILIEKDKKITFPTQIKPSVKPQITKKQGTLGDNLTFGFSPMQFQLPVLDTKIRIHTIKDARETYAPSPFLKFGGGNYGSAYLESGYWKKWSPEMTMFIMAKHGSAQRGPKPVQKLASNSQNDIYLGLQAKIKQSLLDAKFGYERNVVYYYGTGYNTLLSKTDLKQRYQHVYLQSQLEQADTTKSPYKYIVGIHNFSNKNKIVENEIQIKGSQKVGTIGLGYVTLQSDISLSNYANGNRSDDTASLSRYFVQFKPTYTFSPFEKFEASVGFTTAYENDTSGAKKGFHFYPYLQGQYALDQNHKIKAGVDGETQKNTWRTTVSSNPFLERNPVLLLHTHKVYAFYLSIEGNLSPYLVYKTQLAEMGYRNMQFFIPSMRDSTQFSTIYDQKTKATQFSADLGYHRSALLKMGVKGKYTVFRTDTLSYAWLTPTTDVRAYFESNIYNKIGVHADIMYISRLKSRNYQSGAIYDLPAFADVSLLLNYKLNTLVNIWLDGHNLLAQSYQRYVYYNQRRLQIMGGITINF